MVCCGIMRKTVRGYSPSGILDGMSKGDTYPNGGFMGGTLLEKLSDATSALYQSVVGHAGLFALPGCCSNETPLPLLSLE
jgi:hypothetical protein